MRALLALLAALAVLALAAPAAPATEHDPLSPARAVLRLAGDRLDLMRGVMAAKWVARTPVEDRAQEAGVLASARAAAAEHGLDPDGVAAFYEQQIAAAKEVQLGWGGRWLLAGLPADEPVPDLADVRARLAALNPGIVAGLARIDELRCVPRLRPRLERIAGRQLTEPHLSAERRTALVDALLGVEPAGGAAPCDA